MGARAAISAEEYLHTSFADLDREYQDGELVERSWPDKSHARAQVLIAAFFEALAKRLPVFAYAELRLKIRPGLFRIPDVCVYWPEEPSGDVPDVPPFMAIEILSKDDRFGAVRDKLEEYRAWGVKHVWLVDPHGQRMHAYDGGLIESPALRIPELDAEMRPSDVFRAQTPQQ